MIGWSIEDKGVGDRDPLENTLATVSLMPERIVDQMCVDRWLKLGITNSLLPNLTNPERDIHIVTTSCALAEDREISPTHGSTTPRDRITSN